MGAWKRVSEGEREEMREKKREERVGTGPVGRARGGQVARFLCCDCWLLLFVSHKKYDTCAYMLRACALLLRGLAVHESTAAHVAASNLSRRKFSSRSRVAAAALASKMRMALKRERTERAGKKTRTSTYNGNGAPAGLH